MALIDQLPKPENIRRMFLHPLDLPGVDVLDNEPPTADHPCWLTIVDRGGYVLSIRANFAEADELARNLGMNRKDVP